MKYVMAEVFSGKLMELEEDKYTERREKVYTFMKIPREFEKVHVLDRFFCLFINFEIGSNIQIKCFCTFQKTTLRFF